MTPKLPPDSRSRNFHPAGPTARVLAQMDPKWQEALARRGVTLDGAAPPPSAPTPPPAPRRPASVAPAPKPAQSHRQGPPLTRAEKRRRRQEKREANDRRRYDRMVGELRARGAGQDPRPVECPTKIWEMSYLLMASENGDAQRYFLTRERNRALAAAIYEEALAHGRRSWSSLTARRICAFWLVKGALAKYGHKRMGRFGGVHMGFPNDMFLKCLGDPCETRPKKKYPHYNTVFGVHRPGGLSRNGNAGYVHALKKRPWKHAGARRARHADRQRQAWGNDYAGADMAYTQQLPAEQAEPFEVLGESGHALG